MADVWPAGAAIRDRDRRPDDAHDIATSAFLRVTNSTGWVGLDQPQSYLFRAVSSEAHNHQPQRSRRWCRDLHTITAHDATDNPVDVDVIRALSKLTIAQRSVVFLTYWNNMTEAAVADTLGLSTAPFTEPSSAHASNSERHSHECNRTARRSSQRSTGSSSAPLISGRHPMIFYSSPNLDRTDAL